MRGTAAALVRALKYGGWTELADEMGEAMSAVDLGPEASSEVSLIVPVPLSTARRRERGFNQAELLADAVSRRRGWPVRRAVLLRGRHTWRQARLSPAQRSINVTEAFRVSPEGRRWLEGRHVLLVDDVLTTGATALECVRALCRGGARAVSVLVFARAPGGRLG